jgi:hypothetical protein
MEWKRISAPLAWLLGFILPSSAPQMVMPMSSGPALRQRCRIFAPGHCEKAMLENALQHHDGHLTIVGDLSDAFPPCAGCHPSHWIPSGCCLRTSLARLNSVCAQRHHRQNCQEVIPMPVHRVSTPLNLLWESIPPKRLTEN